jgi:uncharacterized protein YaiI (UPF0178 family)
MELFIDADGCPVTNIAVRLAAQFHIPCTLICDTSHQMDRPGVRTIVVSKGADSADFTLVNLIRPGDLVVTQDYGLAAMCLSRKAVPIHQDGMVYTNENIDGLLFFRAAAKKIRNAGGRLKGPSKRTKEQDKAFEAALIRLLEEQT